MSAEQFSHKPRQLIHLQTAREGIFKAVSDLMPELEFQTAQILRSSGEVLEIGPIFDRPTLRFLNNEIKMEQDPALMFDLKQEYINRVLPRIRVTGDNKIEFMAKGKVLGGVNSEQGFWVAERQESDKGFVRKIETFEASETETEQKTLTIYQKHFDDPSNPSGNVYLVTTEFKAVSDKTDFQELMSSWVANGSSIRDLLGIVSIEMNIRLRQHWDKDDGGNGLATLVTSPIIDGGGGKLDL